MKATTLFIRSLAVLSLGCFACAKPAARTEATSGIGTEHSADVVEKEPEVASEETPKEPKIAEPEKRPEKVLLTNAFIANQKLDLIIATDEAVADGRGLAVLAEHLNILGKALSTGIDTQIHFMTGEPLLLPDLAAAKIGFIDQAVGATDIIGLLNTLFANGFAEQYVDAAGELLAAPLAPRQGAKIEIVVFSTGNGEDEGNLAVNFDPNNQLKSSVSAVVATADSVASDECQIEAVSQEYIDLSKKFNGSVYDICSADFAKVFTALASDIAKRQLSFKLEQTPADPKAITVTVNQKLAPKEAWVYDGKNNTIAFLSTSSLVSGAKIEVKYEAKAP